MPRPSGPYLYVATDGVLAKIGIASDVRQRIAQLRSPSGGRVKLVEAWLRPDDFLEIEESIKLRFRPVYQTEWFAMTPAKLVEETLRFMEGPPRPLRHTQSYIDGNAWQIAREEMARYAAWVALPSAPSMPTSR